MGLSRTVSKTNGDFIQNSQTFPTRRAFNAHRRGSPWNWVSAHESKKLEWRGYRPNKNFDDIFSWVDSIHQRDGQMDGQTPDDSKDRAYS